MKIRVYRIAGHGKGELDHISGMTKVAVRREVAAEQSFIHVDDTVEFLEQKFPNHFFDVISAKELEDRQSQDTLLLIKTIDGSSKFQVVVFTSDNKHIKVVRRLCICDSVLVNYDTCHDIALGHPENLTAATVKTLMKLLQTNLLCRVQLLHWVLVYHQ